MVDDLLNLRGFAGDLKLRGEDLAHGKVTMPVVNALGALGPAERVALWDSIRAKPQDQAMIDGVIVTIERAGGLARTEHEAAELVETAWTGHRPAARAVGRQADAARLRVVRARAALLSPESWARSGSVDDEQ